MFAKKESTSKLTKFILCVGKFKTCSTDSFDVDSLFTNIPLGDVLDLLERKLLISSENPFPVNCFIKLVRYE